MAEKKHEAAGDIADRLLDSLKLTYKIGFGSIQLFKFGSDPVSPLFLAQQEKSDASTPSLCVLRQPRFRKDRLFREKTRCRSATDDEASY